MKKPSGEYAQRGDYHLSLEKDWPYLPIYLEKMELAHRFLHSCSKQEVIYDMGCGEGALVNEYRNAGYIITGMDANYSSDFVVQRSFVESELPDNSVDVVLCLDVIEHLSFADQDRAVAELARVLKPGGRALVTVPNLAHLASRLAFFFAGRLIRTSTAERHPGDRPIHEYIRMFRKYFHIRRRKGLFPTFPLISILTVRMPAKVIWLHKLYNRTLAFPNICFLNAFYLENRS
jgi:2-polyprenyl-3-methyl-5-hydroxy-6-metoxy-1,4-benzoquinol methylase